MKSYTDINQSKKLAKILPLQSADMYYINGNTITIGKWKDDTHDEDDVPAWSLAALFNAVNFNTINLHYDNTRKDWLASVTIHDSTKHCTKYESIRADNLVDACYEMILKVL